MISTIVQYTKPRQPVPASHSITIHLTPDQAARAERILLDKQASTPDMAAEDVDACIAFACQVRRMRKAVAS